MHFSRRREGSPKDKILALAKSLPADLVIIASHRPDITTYSLGSNAAAVVVTPLGTGGPLTPQPAASAAFYFRISRPHRCSLPKVPERC